jgi:hypothetical protein
VRPATADSTNGQPTGPAGSFEIRDTLHQALPTDLDTFEAVLSCPGKALSSIPTRDSALLSGDPHRSLLPSVSGLQNVKGAEAEQLNISCLEEVL